jgi:hypothetical protein
MSIVLQSSGGGQITIAEPTTASNFTQTLPAASGEVMVSGNQPAFSAYRSTESGNQSITTDVWTKFGANAEEFDTNNNYDTSLFRFTPTVAGYYQVNLAIYMQASSGFAAVLTCAIYKNGVEFKRGNDVRSASTQIAVPVIGAIIYMNGSTDYLEPYGYIGSATSPIFGTGANFTFSAALVRAA